MWIRTNIPGIKKGEYDAKGEDVVVRVKNHLFGIHDCRNIKSIDLSLYIETW
jgi:hypothetical protein